MSLGLANQYMVHMESPGFSREEEVKEAINGTGMDKYAYQKGINGERLTAKILEPLIDSDSNEFILHSVPLTDRMDIDHILVNRS